MDFQSAMDTFVEAWMAANTKTDQVQVFLRFLILDSTRVGEGSLTG